MTKEKGPGFRMSGNRSHVRYDHRQRPTCIEVRCPTCQGLAVAKEPEFEEGLLVVGDTSPSWGQQRFQMICTECLYRAEGLGYGDLPEPFHQIEEGGDVLWAWNTDHLRMILRSLHGEDVRHDPYGFFETYIHGAWKQHRDRFIKKIESHLRALGKQRTP